MNTHLHGEIFQQVQRGIPGAFLWRARASADGSYQEELLSENSAYLVVDGSIYIKPRSQAPYHLSHDDIIKNGQMFLLVSRSKKEDPPIRFVFEHEGRSFCHDEVEAAAIHLLIWDKQKRIDPTALLFLIWLEGNNTQGAFLGGSQKRLIDYAKGVPHLLGIHGGELHHA